MLTRVNVWSGPNLYRHLVQLMSKSWGRPPIHQSLNNTIVIVFANRVPCQLSYIDIFHYSTEYVVSIRAVHLHILLNV